MGKYKKWLTKHLSSSSENVPQIVTLMLILIQQNVCSIRIYAHKRKNLLDKNCLIETFKFSLQLSEACNLVVPPEGRGPHC